MNSHSLLSSTLTLSLDMHSQTTSKRKAASDHSNPLLNPPKKSKRDKNKSNASKKKPLNVEEQSNGLHGVSQHLPNSDSSLASRPPSSSKPSTRLPNHSVSDYNANGSRTSHRSSSKQPSSRVIESPNVEEDVRAMDNESDLLRRRSVAPVDSPPEAGPSSRPMEFPSQHFDAEMLLPVRDTPQIEKNRAMRDAAMARYHAQLQDTPSKNSRGDDSREGRKATRGNDAIHRRRSSISDRGKRASSIAAAGSVSRPHNSVSEGSFYKHIDFEVPESARARQLLVWCSQRSAAHSNHPPTSISKSSQSKDPPLSPAGQAFLDKLFDDSVKALAERKIPIGTYSHDAMIEDPQRPLAENPQNASNRHWLIVYSDYIDRAKAENDTWNAVEMSYNDYVKMLQAQRTEALATMSNRAKGKQREVLEDEGWDELGPGRGTRSGGQIALARSLVFDQDTNSPSSFSSREARLRDRISHLDRKLDQLYTFTTSATQMTTLAELDMKRRFATLSLALDARNNPPPPLSALGGATSLAGMHQRYIATPDRWSAGSSTNTVDMMRALSRVVSERPATRGGDAARQAIRDVQRVEESGAAVAGQRKLTVSAPMTPRKIPGTPRRGSTPGRER